MAGQFGITVNLGGGATFQQISDVCSDLQTVVSSAYDLAGGIAESEVNAFLLERLQSGGPGEILEQARIRGIPVGDQDLSSEYTSWHWPIRSGFEDLDEYTHYETYGVPWIRALGQLRAHEIAQRLPEQRARVLSLRYQNPIWVDVIAATGPASTGLAYLLWVIRDFGARRRREYARTSAEERIQRAAAYDAEDQATARAQLRAIALEQFARGETTVPNSLLQSIFTDQMVLAASRLADRELTYEQSDAAN